MSSTAIHNMFTEEELVEIITTQKKCFMRKCSHKCSKCLYHQNPERIIAAYNQILDLLATQKSIKREFFSSGIEYASRQLIDSPMVAQVCFTEEEVMRHPLVKMVAQRQKAEKVQQSTPESEGI